MRKRVLVVGGLGGVFDSPFAPHLEDLRKLALDLGASFDAYNCNDGYGAGPYASADRLVRIEHSFGGCRGHLDDVNNAGNFDSCETHVFRIDPVRFTNDDRPQTYRFNPFAQ